jgi:hypothetical protein
LPSPKSQKNVANVSGRVGKNLYCGGKLSITITSKLMGQAEGSIGSLTTVESLEKVCVKQLSAEIMKVILKVKILFIGKAFKVY